MRPLAPTSGLLCVAALLSAGCASTPSTERAAAECGLGGAGLGYLACKLAGHTDEDCAKFALGTGVVGAWACSVYAQNLQKRQQALAGKEHDLDAQIQYVQGLNTDTRQLNAELTQRVVAITQETDQLVAQIRDQKQQLTAAQVAEVQKKRDDALKRARDEVAQGSSALLTAKTMRDQRTDPSSELNAAIAEQERLLAEAQHQVDLLAAQRARV